MMIVSLLRPVCVLTAAALLLLVHPSAAQSQSAEAEALFRAGKELIKAGNIAEGCAKLEASDRLERSVGTELNLADCREKNHQLATAWATFLKAAGNAKAAGNDAKREAEARERASRLEARLSYLTISVPDASKVEGLEIFRNGQPEDPAMWNEGIPVDEGEYEITARVPGHEPWRTKVTINREGDKQSVEVPRFKAIEELVPDVDLGKPLPSGPSRRHDGDVSPGMFTTKRKIAVGGTAVGVLGLSGAILLGLEAKDLQGQADALCPAAACGNQRALDLNADAQSAALKSNILLGVGIAGVAGAAVLWFLGAPRDVRPGADGNGSELSIAPVIGRDQASVTLGGRF